MSAMSETTAELAICGANWKQTRASKAQLRVMAITRAQAQKYKAEQAANEQQEKKDGLVVHSQNNISYLGERPLPVPCKRKNAAPVSSLQAMQSRDDQLIQCPEVQTDMTEPPEIADEQQKDQTLAPWREKAELGEMGLFYDDRSVMRQMSSNQLGGPRFLLVIPWPFREKVLKLTHDQHGYLGTKKMKAQLGWLYKGNTEGFCGIHRKLER